MALRVVDAGAILRRCLSVRDYLTIVHRDKPLVVGMCGRVWAIDVAHKNGL